MLPRDSDGWYTIRISANIIKWPPQCVCCCGPSHTDFDISYSRTKGVRVVHVETKTWGIPYCVDCLRHIVCLKNAERKYGEAREAEEQAKLCFAPVIQCRSPYVAAGVGVFVTCCVVAGIFILGRLATSDSHPPIARAIFCSFFAILAGIGSVILTIYFHRKAAQECAARQHALELAVEQDREELTAQATKLHEESEKEYAAAADSVRASCSWNHNLAIVYAGWHGSLHTFRFANETYAEAFVMANEKKMVHPTKAYLVSWAARILSLRNSLSR